MPEEVHRARLAAVPAGELLEHRVRPVEDPPEALDRVSIVGGVLVVCRKWRGRLQPERQLADRDVDAEPKQDLVQLRVESRDGEPVDEGKRLHRAAVRADDEAVVDEVEVDLEGRAARRVQSASRQSADVDVERHVPPVISRRRRGHPHLADDLRPEVQRVLRRLPLFERQRWQVRVAAHAYAESTLERMSTDTAAAAVETRIGTIGIEATETGVRRVRLPGESADAGRSSTGTAAPRRTCPRRRLSSPSTRAGSASSFEVTLDWDGVEPMHRRVLETLREMAPYGTTVTYGGARAASRRRGPARRRRVHGAEPVPARHPVPSRRRVGRARRIRRRARAQDAAPRARRSPSAATRSRRRLTSSGLVR